MSAKSEHATASDSLGRVGIAVEGNGIIETKPLEPFRPDTMGCGHANDVAIDDENHAP